MLTFAEVSDVVSSLMTVLKLRGKPAADRIPTISKTREIGIGNTFEGILWEKCVQLPQIGINVRTGVIFRVVLGELQAGNRRASRM